MRTRTLLLTAAALAAGALCSFAQSNVYSLNVVGYVNVTLMGNGLYTAIANPLNTTNNTLGSLFSTLPNSTQVMKYNPSIADYDVYGKIGFGAGWTPASGATTSLKPGEGCLIKTPAGSTNLTWTFVGDVMQATTAPLTNAMITGYQLVGNIVPDSGPVTSLELTNVPAGSQLMKWDTTLQDFVTYGKITFGSGWTPSVPSLSVADGFFINAAAPFDWVRTFVVQ